jgi:uncharacterized protein (DUF2141 family)
MKMEGKKLGRRLAMVGLVVTVLLSLGILGNLAFISQRAAQTGCISGTVYYSGHEMGRIYIMAFKATEDCWEDRQRLREIQTEDKPYKFAHSFVSLDTPGRYTISNLEDGSYKIWAWRDVNDDGDVDFADFEEPTGWYQTPPDDLGLVEVEVSSGGVTNNIHIQLLSPTPFPKGDEEIRYGKGGGTLKTIKGRKVLHLWGTSEERAYAHGYLTGAQIMDWLNYVAVEYFAGSVSDYEGRVLEKQTQYTWPKEVEAELDAMLKGMQDSDTDLYSDLLGRLITRNDLYALQDWGDWWCSGASVWGKWTQNKELNGELIQGKNMDGETDLRKITVNDLLIFANEPADSARAKWIGLNWPGFIGEYNGMNQYGVTAVTHTGNSPANWEPTNLHTPPLIYREIMERAHNISEAVEIIFSHSSSAGGPVPKGEIINMASPYSEDQRGHPAAALECDSYGGVARYPGEVPPSDPYTMLVTNTFFKYKGGESRSPTECVRYRAMVKTLEQFRRRNKSIGTEEMVEILQSATHGNTEYSNILYPNKMAIAVATEGLKDGTKNLNAPYCEFTVYEWRELFE